MEPSNSSTPSLEQRFSKTLNREELFLASSEATRQDFFQQMAQQFGLFSVSAMNVVIKDYWRPGPSNLPLANQTKFFLEAKRQANLNLIQLNRAIENSWRRRTPHLGIPQLDATETLHYIRV